MVLRLRGGADLAAAFGPTAGAPAVRNGTGPRTVTAPGGAVAFTSQADLVSKITSNPPSTSFVSPSGGTLVWNGAAVHHQNKNPRVYFIGGIILDGTSESAGGPTGFDFTNAEIHGGTFRNFNKGIAGYNDVIVEDVEVRNCYQNGVVFLGDNSRISHAKLHTNGLTALTVTNTSLTGQIVEYCEFTNNMTRQTPWDVEGGIKLVCGHPIFRNNWVHDNFGNGIWFDFSFGSLLCEENVSENNERNGIFYEVGTSDLGQAEGIIRRNAVINNGLAVGDDPNSDSGILITDTDGQLNGGTGWEVYNNYIDAGEKGLFLVDHSGHPQYTRSGSIHHNDIWLRNTTGTPMVGAFSSAFAPKADPSSIFFSSNTFESNSYHVLTGSLGQDFFNWTNIAPFTGYQPKTWAQWQAFGHDDTGTLVENAQWW